MGDQSESQRPDGRQSDDLRPVRFVLDYVDYPEGSVLIHMGRTRVLCNVTLEDRPPNWLAGSGQGWVTAEYALLPRSTHTRTRRETRGLGGRTQEIRRLIGRSLRAAVDLERMGERMFIVDCDVLQADGGTRTAAITGGYVALALAIRRLTPKGDLPTDLIRTPVAAISVGMIEGQPRLDLCYEEDKAAEVDLNVVMTGQGEFVEVQGTAEGAPFSKTELNEMLALADKGIAELIAAQWEVLQ